MKVTVNQLKEIANEFLNDNFNMDLNIPIIINKRLSTSAGRFKGSINPFNSSRISIKIDIASNILDDNLDDIIKVLKHELIHYALFERNEPFKDSDYHFQETLRRFDLPSHYRPKACYRQQHVYSCDCCKTNNKLDCKKYSKFHTFINKFRADRYCLRCDKNLEYLGRFKCKFENGILIDVEGL